MTFYTITSCNKIVIIPLNFLYLIMFSYINLQFIHLFYMPQLVPFFFINQVIFAFAVLVMLIYVFSKYILPRFVRLFATRVFISKL